MMQGLAAGTVLVVGGPTASGKSGLAAALAEKLAGIVINADSMQIYDGLPILTAQPAAEDKARAPHRLYGVLAPEETCSAARWREMVLAEIHTAQAGGHVPVVAGGTGFYIKALLEGMSPIPDVPAHFREEAIRKQQELGNPAFHAALAKRDLQTAAKLDPLNTQRLVRAWEVLEATGQSLAAWQEAPRIGPPEDLRFVVITLHPPRETLYAACDGRFTAMLAAGALEEARAFKAAAADMPRALDKALGYPELAAHLGGEISLDEAAGQARLSTRHYAKRQVTWFRHQITADIVLEKPDAAPVLQKLGL